MYNFIVKLDPETREELYSDASEAFMGFLLIEALLNIIVAGVPGCLETLDRMESLSREEHFASQYDTSVDYLLEINKDLNEQCGIYLTEEDCCFNSDAHDAISFKLSEAIESIEARNDLGEILVLKEVFEDPHVVEGFKFTAMHFRDRVAFCLVPVPKSAQDMVGSLNGLLKDYAINNDSNPDYWLDPSALSLQNLLFNQRS